MKEFFLLLLMATHISPSFFMKTSINHNTKEPVLLEVQHTSFREETCQPPCQNNGICKIGKCYCPNNYIGQYCEQKFEDELRIDGTLAIVICLISVFLGALCVWLMTVCYNKVTGYSKDRIIRNREVYYENF